MVVDAIYGTGFKGALPPEIREVVDVVNQADAVRLAVDIPSGVDSSTGRVEGTAFLADYTVTFGLPKRGQILYHGKSYCGKLFVEDISFPEKLIKEYPVKRWLVAKNFIVKILKPIAPDTHKGRQGFGVVVGGSLDYSGAPLLAAKASLTSGIGGVFLFVPEDLFGVLAGKAPEVILRGVKISSEGFKKIEDVLTKARAVVIGPGLGVFSEEREAYLKFIENCPVPLVIDADGLNNLVGNLEILKKRTAPTILTPHLGEMVRLTGKSIEELKENREEIGKNFALEYNVTLILKSETTVVFSPEGEVWYYPGGHPILAKAGSGDILAGLILGFLAQGYEPLEAALLAVYFHQRAGELAQKENSPRSFFLTAIFSYLNKAFGEIEREFGNKTFHMEK